MTRGYIIRGYLGHLTIKPVNDSLLFYVDHTQDDQAITYFKKEGRKTDW